MEGGFSSCSGGEGFDQLSIKSAMAMNEADQVQPVCCKQARLYLRGSGQPVSVLQRNVDATSAVHAKFRPKVFIYWGALHLQVSYRVTREA